MSEEMAVCDNATGEDATGQGGDTAAESVDQVAEASPNQPNDAPPEHQDDTAPVEEAPPQNIKVEPPSTDLEIENQSNELDLKPEIVKSEDDDDMDGIKDDSTAPIDGVKDEIQADSKDYTIEIEKRGIKRRASDAFSDEGDVEFKGFDNIKTEIVAADYTSVLERLEAEVSAARKDFTPVRHVMATPAAPLGTRPAKRPRNDTDGSRPSSAQSSRSEGDDNPSASPAHRGRRPTTEMSSPLLRIPLERGWKRELVYRAALDAYSRRNADIYYYTPQGKKLRSTREVAEQLGGTGLTLENFSFFKEPLGVDDPEKEIIRDAKLMRRMESPSSSPAPAPVIIEGKRTPKPKPPKGASPEPITPKSPPAKLKVKSMGARLSNSTPASAKQQKKGPAASPAPAPASAATPAPAPTDNNNTAAWKKPSEDKRRTRVTNGAVTPTTPAPIASPRRRGRPRPDDTDHFTAFYKRAQGTGRDVALQIFQYLGMRELARCASVCKLWCQLAATPALWRHVRMKNSHVSEWSGLCASLKRHGTKWLDLRKMLLPQNDTIFWEQFSQHIATVDTLERLELCRCPAKAVEAACTALPGLTSLAALAIKDGTLDPRPLARAPKLQELRIKSLAGLALTADLTPLAGLHHLRHLSLTSIKELGWRACDVVGSLPLLESLELGECTFRAEFGAVLAKLSRLRRLRLERGTALTPAADILRAIAALPALNALELVNVDVKLGFDDALAACTNIQRLLIIPTYVSQSATTNQQVLSGLLRLKDTLTHLMWGVTIELLRVTELFIDQCSAGGAAAGAGARRELGECIPVLKPVPGCRLPMDHQLVAGPPQVEILPLPTLQRLLSAQLPNTKLKLLRIPFHATWRQSLADFQ